MAVLPRAIEAECAPSWKESASLFKMHSSASILFQTQRDHSEVQA